MSELLLHSEYTSRQQAAAPGRASQSRFVEAAISPQTIFKGQPYVSIRNVDRLDPFLMNVVSNGDLWMFVGSNTAITAGRRDPDHALFPYQTADKLLSQPQNSGVLSIFLVNRGGVTSVWMPWSAGQSTDKVSRHLYKHAFGTSVVFEETNHTLGLRLRWSLAASEDYGLVREATLENLSEQALSIRYLDGWQQLLPAGVTQDTYSRYSYLASAYMRHECLREQNLALYTLNSGITDRAEPCESLRISCAWSVGHPQPAVLLSDRQVDAFRRGQPVDAEDEVRGEFGAYLVADSIELAAGQAHEWFTVADIGLDHSAAGVLLNALREPEQLAVSLAENLEENVKMLRRRIASADGLQQTADRAASVHHFANVLFNCMRGGTLCDSYNFPETDFAAFLRSRNVTIYRRHQKWLESLAAVSLDELQQQAELSGDRQLIRLTREYLPLCFSRRHGDPSRPWNRFVIQTRDEHHHPLYGYQGNWRDIFQNWEGLAQSYPLCLDAMISVFLNASTADGYNPYRITRDAIEWEIFDAEDPWSHIGYWGDHQIIYLLRLLESRERFWPGQLAAGLREKRYAYASVPYEIGGFEAVLEDPRNSITFNKNLHNRLLARFEEIGGDGKLLEDDAGEVVLVSLAEKLLVPMLVKLSNLIPGGGIWLNTQRPEWNDANNALAGWGLSVVTVCYLRRYLSFVDGLFASMGGLSLELSAPVARLLSELTLILPRAARPSLDDARRFAIAAELGKSGETHRQAVYTRTAGEPVSVGIAAVRELIRVALSAVNATLNANRRADGMIHSYNLLNIGDGKASVQHLCIMLEGQVAALSSGLLSADEAVCLLSSLRRSALYRPDQLSYLLYPDREIAPFLARNVLPEGWQFVAPVLAELQAAGRNSLISLGMSGTAHFQADLTNSAGLNKRMDALEADPRWSRAITRDRTAVLALWEKVFQHSTFTGRSGSMFAFEGLGSIYWHMIAKLLLAVQETHARAQISSEKDFTVAALRAAYNEVRLGLGFTKTAEAYGAFPTDPYSHTPRHRGAQQPGMTGQVKEEILSRIGELGVETLNGRISFVPRLLELAEFSSDAQHFEYVDVLGVEQTCELPSGSLAFTFCQVPIVYVLGEQSSITLTRQTGEVTFIIGSSLSATESAEIFRRSAAITALTVTVPRSLIGKYEL